MKKILLPFGTRPETIKLAPLVKELQKFPDAFSIILCSARQHLEMLNQVIDLFQFTLDYEAGSGSLRCHIRRIDGNEKDIRRNLP
jgi:UDP-N-acetylglucosamine 2-epimerase (non-hydrolysing)